MLCVITLCVFRCADVNVAFQQAAHKVLLDDDNLLPLLHLTVDYQGKDGKGEQPSAFRRQPEKTGGVWCHPVVSGWNCRSVFTPNAVFRHDRFQRWSHSSTRHLAS